MGLSLVVSCGKPAKKTADLSTALRSGLHGTPGRRDDNSVASEISIFSWKNISPIHSQNCHLACPRRAVGPERSAAGEICGHLYSASQAPGCPTSRSFFARCGLPLPFPRNSDGSDSFLEETASQSSGRATAVLEDATITKACAVPLFYCWHLPCQPSPVADITP